VIGGLGFIGGNLTRALTQRGAQVTVLTPTRERHEAQARDFERHGVRIVEGDVRDRGLMSHLVVAQQGVFNLAGQSGAVRSMEDPWTDLDVNCRGNLVLLESIRECAPHAKLVFVGSRLQYGRPVRLPVNEDDTNPALCVHAIHKRTVEEYVQLYGRLFGVRYSIARVTNPYGPGQPRGRTAYGIINRLIHLALADDVVPLYGDGSQLRDYVHVDDVVSALLGLMETPASDGRTYNVGSGEGHRMVDVARVITELAGGGRIAHVEWPSLAAQIETGDFVADISRIRREVGWTPRIGLRDGLERTIAHYRALAVS
jgi:nucleoside-diphosphate-sugar epimerase